MGEIKNKRRRIIGIVAGNKADKTIKVRVVRVKTHPLYKRQMKIVKHILAHDENNICKIGDKVEVIESRPLSKRKRWNLVKIIEKAK